MDDHSLITGEKVQFASPTAMVLESIRESCDKAFPDGESCPCSPGNTIFSLLLLGTAHYVLCREFPFGFRRIDFSYILQRLGKLQ